MERSGCVFVTGKSMDGSAVPIPVETIGMKCLLLGELKRAIRVPLPQEHAGFQAWSRDEVRDWEEWKNRVWVEASIIRAVVQSDEMLLYLWNRESVADNR